MALRRIIVCGSRDWGVANPRHEESAVKRALQECACIHDFLSWYRYLHVQGIEIITGDGTGADQVGKRWAISNGIEHRSFPAKWDLYGRAAGPIRNREMAIYGADDCVAFWDGESTGTKSMIGLARDHGIPVTIQRINEVGA